MRVVSTALPEVLLIEPGRIVDARGWLVETYQRDRYAAAGIADFVQDNLSSSARGVLRGLHYRVRAPQGKLVYVTHGAVFDVAVDVRAGSPTFGMWVGAELSADNQLQMWIPPGFAHGFLTQTERADVAYKLTAAYDAADERTLAWNDPQIGIAWPLASEPILSDRDRTAPLLRDAELPR